MNPRFVLILILLDAMAYGLAFGTGRALVKVLSGPRRRATSAHWTERARLAFAPGAAVVCLAVMLPPAVAILAEVGLEMLQPQKPAGMPGFWTAGLAAVGGVLTARYRWLRELWGVRVTIRSWLAGCLVLVLLFVPHLLVMSVLVILLPDTPNVHSALLIGAGVVAVAFFASGGGVLLLRLLRVMRPAPPHVAVLVEQLAREMKVRGRVRVFELEWAQVNAVASVLYRAVGFSRPLLEIMTPDELRAIAAHEIAHLLEPQWVRAVRVLHMFAYLAAVPVIKYGGTGGSFAGWLLIMVLVLAYQRFRRRMEVRADRLESQTVADANTYMRSMIKLHEANMLPAVMPGAQSHPHLYDRLLAGGIQPEFPRPMAPSRGKPLLAALAATIAATVVMFIIVVFAMCCQRLIGALHPAPSAQPPPARAQPGSATFGHPERGRDGLVPA